MTDADRIIHSIRRRAFPIRFARALAGMLRENVTVTQAVTAAWRIASL